MEKLTITNTRDIGNDETFELFFNNLENAKKVRDNIIQELNCGAKCIIGA